MSFGAPHLLWLLLAAPLAAWLAASAWRRRLAADTAWAARGLWGRLLPAFAPRRITLSVATLAVALAALGLGLAQPRWGNAVEKVERRGVDVVFLVDSSLSMGAQDVAPSGLFVAKSLVRRMTQAMPGNRVGLVQSEGDGVVLAPLTLDGAVLDLLLDTIDPGSLPIPGTELGTGLDTALRLFGEERTKHRALVILSDGEDHGGGIERRIQRLKEAGVVVFAVGLGTKEGAFVPLPAAAGGDFRRDASGNRVTTRLEEAGLRQLAGGTGGAYLRARSAGADVESIVGPIQRMRKRTLEGEVVATERERFQWPLALGAAALLCHLGVRPFRSAAKRQESAARAR
jgi:Ca-activated chloride channel family protein